MICKHCLGLIQHQGRIFCSLSCSTSYRNRTTIESKILTYEKSPTICQNPDCKKPLPFDKRKNKFCSNSCAAIINNKGYRKRGPDPRTRYPFSRVSFLICEITGKPYSSRNKDGAIRKRSPYIAKSEIEKYYEECRFRFNVYHFPNEFDLSMIEQYGWYSTPGSRKGVNNLEGISRDHIISKRYGYENHIDPSLISHPANCQLISHRENKAKGTVPAMTVEELVSKINTWNQKYQNWKKN
jgi:hypothetical protein